MIEKSLAHGVALRRFPYPYRAMFAICSDLDETPDKRSYFETMRFLNTTEETAIGQGVGLEVGNTIYFDMPQDQFSYWNTDLAGRDMVRACIKSGHIDCLHSYGDLATTREYAGRALDELDRYDCHLKVWVDHGTAPTNFDSDIMKGCGDIPGNPAYHADLTHSFGVEFVWLGRVTSVVGQNVARTLSGIWTPAHPLQSGRTLFKEFAKGAVGRIGRKKYVMHGPNRILRPSKLHAGQPIYEFMRSNPYWGGIGLAATATGVGEVLTEAMLSRLTKRQGAGVLYTHLGKIGSNSHIFKTKAKNAFGLLVEFMKNGFILVTTTKRLLEYCRMKDDIDVSVEKDRNGININAFSPRTGESYEGLTFYVPDNKKIDLCLNGRKVDSFYENKRDETGQASISVKWSKLNFPSIMP